MFEKYYSKNGKTRATIEGSRGDQYLFAVEYEKNSGYIDTYYEYHKMHLYEWAKHLHGNAPSGTPYGYIRASRNGQRIVITV